MLTCVSSLPRRTAAPSGFRLNRGRSHPGRGHTENAKNSTMTIRAVPSASSAVACAPDTPASTKRGQVAMPSRQNRQKRWPSWENEPGERTPPPRWLSPHRPRGTNRRPASPPAGRLTWPRGRVDHFGAASMPSPTYHSEPTVGPKSCASRKERCARGPEGNERLAAPVRGEPGDRARDLADWARSAAPAPRRISRSRPHCLRPPCYSVSAIRPELRVRISEARRH